MLLALSACALCVWRAVGWEGVLLPALLVACSAAALSAAGALASGEALSASLARGVAGWEFRVSGDAVESGWGYRCRAKARMAGGGTSPCLGDVWLMTSEPLALGDLVEVSGSYSQVDPDDEWGMVCRAQGVWGSVRVTSVRQRGRVGGPHGAIVGLRSQALTAIDPTSSRERALLAGLVCGYRGAMANNGDDALFSRCGVSHLVSVSGGHIAVVAMIVGEVLSRTRMGPKARALVVLAVSAVFVMLCGAPVSAVRSWLMAVVVFCAQLAGRRSHALSGVCAMALGMALLEPAVAGQLGFLLSVSSVVGLCLFARYADYALGRLLPTPELGREVPRRVREALRRVCDSARGTLAATIVAQAFTLPVTLPAFGELSVVAPLANLLLSLAFVPLVCLGLLVVVSSGLPGVSHVVLRLTDVLCRCALVALDALGSSPHASTLVEVGEWIAIPAVACIAGLLVWWPRVRGRVVRGCVCAGILAFAAFGAYWRYLAPARIVVLDVGQGDAILVQDGAHALLVDTGPDEAVARALAREHVTHLDAVLITHMHDDHYGGTDELVGRCGVDEVLVAEGVSGRVPEELSRATDDLTDAVCSEVSYGDIIGVGRYEVRIVWPTTPVDGSENAHSVMAVVSFSGREGELVALLTGDAEEQELSQVIARGDVGDIDLLKVGHHGSDVSISDAEAQVILPEVAIASAGEGNPYGHPTQECIDVLERSGTRFFCTIEHGDIEVRPHREGAIVCLGG